MELNEQTHDEFFKVITRKKLHELFLQASRTNILQNQINRGLPEGYVRVEVTKKPSECGIYFNYYSKDNIKQGHITLHFKKADKIKNSQWGNRNINIGRFHMKNNIHIHKKYTLRINKQGTDKIQIYLSHRAVDVRTELHLFTKYVIDILNIYFDPESNDYLGKYKFPNQVHPCVAILDKAMTRSKTPLRNTRKKSYTSIPIRSTSIPSLSYKNVISVSGMDTPSNER
jgi:hypothetical protein